LLKLDDEQRMILETVRRIAAKEIAPKAAELDETAAFPHHAVAAFADNGLLNPLLPAQYGGVEQSLLMVSLIFEEIGRVCAASALLLIAQSDGMLPILHGGSDALKEKYLSRLEGDSRELTALAATEPSAGSDVLSMRTKAVRKGDTYVVNGQKCFITNGSVADFFVLYAYTDASKGARGMSAFVVEKTFPGLVYGKNENKMGMRGSVNSELFFEDLEVPAENLIGVEGQGFANLMKTLAMSRLFCASQAVGIAQGALDEAVTYARERVQFGKPIADLAPIQFMIADMAAAVEASRLLTHEAAELFDNGETVRAGTLAAMAKFTASDTAMRVTTDTVQILGGYGYMKDYPVERMMRDAKLTQIYTGTNQIMRLVAGRDLLLSD
jgi:alkylation response protein AidB-like acyl-CoA dehydrogenase